MSSSSLSLWELTISVWLRKHRDLMQKSQINSEKWISSLTNTAWNLAPHKAECQHSSPWERVPSGWKILEKKKTGNFSREIISPRVYSMCQKHMTWRMGHADYTAWESLIPVLPYITMLIAGTWVILEWQGLHWSQYHNGTELCPLRSYCAVSANPQRRTMPLLGRAGYVMCTPSQNRSLGVKMVRDIQSTRCPPQVQRRLLFDKPCEVSGNWLSFMPGSWDEFLDYTKKFSYLDCISLTFNSAKWQLPGWYTAHNTT